MANYHPNDELLMSFAAGQLPNALGVMLACHIESCPLCRQKVKQYEAVGGELLSLANEQRMSSNALEGVLSRLDEAEEPKPTFSTGQMQLPRPLRRFVPTGFDELNWSGMSRSIREYEIQIHDPVFTAKFYKIAAGKELPEHTHRGQEYTYVVEGSFSDRSSCYRQGDFVLADTQTVHQPRASDDSDCICFAVMDAPLKMTGFFGRMLNPFLR